MIKFRCSCGQKISAEDARAGKLGRCPKCGSRVQVPPLPESPPPQSPALGPESDLYSLKRESGPGLQARPYDVAPWEKEVPKEKVKPPETAKKAEEGIPEAYELAEEEPLKKSESAGKPRPQAPRKAHEEPPASEAAPEAEEVTLEATPEKPAGRPAAAGVCLNCGKPVSFVVKAELGYYCSRECRAASRARAPRAEELGEKVSRFRDMLKYVALGAGGLIVVAIIVVGAKLAARGAQPAVRWGWGMHGGSEGLGYPLLVSGELYVGRVDGTFLRYDAASGSEAWGAPLTGRIRDDVPPRVVGDRIIVTGDTSLWSLNRSNGSILWRVELPGPLVFGPVASDTGIIYVGTGTDDMLPSMGDYSYVPVQTEGGYPGWDHYRPLGPPPRPGQRGASFVLALDGDTGGRRWTLDTNNGRPLAILPKGERTFVVVSPTGGEPCSLWAIDVASGSVSWTRPLEPGPGWGVAGLDNAVLCYGSGGLISFADDGAELWRVSLPGVAARVAIHQGKVYVKSEDGKLVCVDAAEGKTIWERPIGKAYFPPVVSGGRVYALGINETRPLPQPKDATRLIRAYREAAERMRKGEEIIRHVPDLYCLDGETGQELWVKERAGDRLLAVRGALITLRTAESHSDMRREPWYRTWIYAWNAKDGENLAALDDDGLIRGLPAASDNLAVMNLHGLSRDATRKVIATGGRLRTIVLR